MTIIGFVWPNWYGHFVISIYNMAPLLLVLSTRKQGEVQFRMSRERDYKFYNNLGYFSLIHNADRGIVG